MIEINSHILLAAKCGLYCGQCTGREDDVKKTAQKLHDLIQRDFTWMKNENIELGFEYENFLNGLEWFIQESQCPSCSKIKEPWCEVLKCPKIQTEEVKNCLLCSNFLQCPRTAYQRDRYPFVKAHYRRVKEIGFKEHLAEEHQKARDGLRIQDIRKY